MQVLINPTTVTLQPTSLDLPKQLGLPVLDAIDGDGNVLLLVALHKNALDYKLGMKKPGEKFGIEIDLTHHTKEEHRKAFDYLAARFNVVIDWENTFV